MVKTSTYLKIGGIVFFVLAVATIAARESGIPITFFYFLPFVVGISIVGGIYYAAKKFWMKEEEPHTGFKSFSVEQIRFIAAKHLIENHGIDIFSTEEKDNWKTARYMANIYTGSCFPSSDEEVAFVRMTVNDKRYFHGEMTKIIIFINGNGAVIDDPMMNISGRNALPMDDDLWRHPENWFIRNPPKTSRRRSLNDLLAQRFEETGELPQMMQQQEKEE